MSRIFNDTLLHFSFSHSAQCPAALLTALVCRVLQTNSGGVDVKGLYFTYLAILRKVANHVALLQSADGTSRKQVELTTPAAILP